VGLDDRPFLHIELARLVDDFFGDGDLSDIVEQGAEFEVAALLCGERGSVGDGEA
jgi:hypothetical protein